VVCAGGANITLIESGSGSWTSNNTSLAIVGTSSGIVTGLLPGVDTIVYTIGVGCTASKIITINPIPAAITGTPNACIGKTSTLGDVTGLGSWSSSATATATVGSGTGVVSGVAAGTAIITYTIPTGCYNTQSFTVNPLPLAITGT